MDLHYLCLDFELCDTCREGSGLQGLCMLAREWHSLGNVEMS